MKKVRMFLLLIAMIAAVTLTACGGGGGSSDSGGGSGGGTAPSGTTSVNLPETGQGICYDATGNAIACAGTGQDGELQRGVAWPSPRFTVDGTGLCVTDNLTGLMWVRNPDSIGRTWANALTYANGLTLCGYSDWRLPNRKELRSLINYGEANTATWLNGQGFSNVQASYYWSSSTHAFSTANAWEVDMNGGSLYGNFKTNTLYVWPVRAGQGGAPADLPETGQTFCYDETGVFIPCANTGEDGELQRGVAWPSPRFTVDGTGLCVTDNLTGLMWVRTPDSTLRTWANALTYANGLSLCGYDDWRLPNVNEFESLINAQQANTNTWLNAQGFSSVQAIPYWSSSTNANANFTDYARSVNMGDGRVTAYVKTDFYFVWPVRAGQ